MSGPRVVALGGGHGLAASLAALRNVTDELTAIVTVADDGGSSGRLRRELGVLPPGDLRMALAALCGDDEWGVTWSKVVQHRFAAEGDLHGHAVGNLLIVALWELLGDTVTGLDWVGRLLGARGRVLPMSAVPLEIEAVVTGLHPADTDTDPHADTDTDTDTDTHADTEAGVRIRGQVAIATTPGKVRDITLVPADPPACPEAVEAVTTADWVVFGPGSWFTSVLPHLMVPDLAHAIRTTGARRLVVLNLEPQQGETTGFSPETYLEVLRAHSPDLRLDVVLADSEAVPDVGALRKAAEHAGAELELFPVALGDGTPRHDPGKLAAAYRAIFASGRVDSWR